MTIDLDRLEAFAKAAIPNDVNGVIAWYDYADANNPTVCLSLIAVVRAAQSLKHIGSQMVAEDWAAFNELEYSLKPFAKENV